MTTFQLHSYYLLLINVVFIKEIMTFSSNRLQLSHDLNVEQQSTRILSLSSSTSPIENIMKKEIEKGNIIINNNNNDNNDNNNNSLEQPLKKIKKYHPNRYRQINEYFQYSQLNVIIPREITEIIGEYDFNDRALDELFKQITNELNLLNKNNDNNNNNKNKKEENDNDLLDLESSFYDVNFAGKLVKVIEDISNPLIFYKICHDASRLIFKWIVHLRKVFHYNLFDQVLKHIESDYKSLKFTVNHPLPDFNDLNLDDWYFVNCSKENFFCPYSDLLYYEIFDRGQDIFDLYEMVLEEFYHKTGNCDFILKKYFDGYFHNNSILKFMIDKYDTNRELRKCFKNFNYSISPSKQKYPIIQIKSQVIRDFHQIHVFDFHVNTFILDFYLKNNFRFQIDNHTDLYTLLHALERVKLLNMKIIEKFMGFPSEWNHGKFIEYFYNGENSLPQNFKAFKDSLNIY